MPFLITRPVGNNRDNDEDDVFAVKDALARLERFEAEPEPHGYITRDLDTAIRGFQRDNGLREDGMLLPRGETETALSQSLDRQFRDRQARQLEGVRRALGRTPLFGRSVSRLQFTRLGEGDEGDDGDSNGGNGDEGNGNDGGDGGADPAPNPPPPPAPDSEPEPEPEPHPQPDDEDDAPTPPKPPRKPSTPNPEEGDERECSHLELALANARSMAEQRQALLDAQEAKAGPLENELESLEAKISEAENAINETKVGVSGIASISGAIGAAIISRNPLAAIPGGRLGLEGAERVNWLLDQQLAALRKRRDEVLADLEPLRAEISELQLFLNDAKTVVNEAQEALNTCLAASG